MKYKSVNLLLCFSLFTFISCSESGWGSPDALIGTVLGAGAGAGGAILLGVDDSNKVLTALGVGAGVGLVLGKMFNEYRLENDPDRLQHVIRKPAYKDSLQREKEIELLNKQIHDSGKWGRSETKPWKERYRGEDKNVPYLGGVGK